MTKQEIINNCIIADWLGWTNEYCPGAYFPPINTRLKECLADFELQFHTDINWMWFALEKIADSESCSIQMAINIIGTDEDSQRDVNSKQDLFDAIVKYITSKNQ